MRNSLYVKAMTALFLASTTLGSSAYAQLTEGEKDTIYVGPIQVQPSVEEAAQRKGRTLELKRAVEVLDTQFTTALNATSVFQLVDRKRIADIQTEQGFAQNSGMVDPNDKNTAKVGKMAGAKFAFLPQIDAFDVRASSTQYRDIARVSSSRSLYFSAVVQVVDTTTGKILPDAPSVQLTSAESVELARLGTSAGSDAAIVALAKEMAGKLAQGVVALIRPAKVLTVTGKQIMLNRGTESGFTPGKKIEFYATQDVKDEDSGEIFKNEILVGKGSVDRADPRKSFATLEGEDLGVAKGVVAKLAKVAPPKGISAKKAAEREDRALGAGSSEKPLNF